VASKVTDEMRSATCGPSAVRVQQADTGRREGWGERNERMKNKKFGMHNEAKINGGCIVALITKHRFPQGFYSVNVTYCSIVHCVRGKQMNTALCFGRTIGLRLQACS